MTGSQADARLADKYSHAINYVNAHFSGRSEQKRQGLLNILIQTCEQALIYSWHEAAKRKIDREAFKKRQTIANQAKKIAAFCRKHPSIMVVAIGKAAISSGVALRVEQDGDDVGQASFIGPGQSFRLARLLDEVASETERLRDNTIPFMHRKRVGPLLFDTLLDQIADIPSKETCLGIFLLFIVKRFSRDGSLGFITGETMPSDGDPHWALIERLVEATYGPQRDTKSSVAKQTRKYPGLRLLGYLEDAPQEK